MRYNSCNRYLRIDGEEKTLREWSLESGVPENLIHWRLSQIPKELSNEEYEIAVEEAVYKKPRRYVRHGKSNTQNAT